MLILNVENRTDKKIYSTTTQNKQVLLNTFSNDTTWGSFFMSDASLVSSPNFFLLIHTCSTAKDL